MSTWLELRQEVLGMLDVKLDVSAASSIRTLVDIKLKRQRDYLYSLRQPRKQLVYSAAVTVDVDTVAIKCTGSGAAGYPSFGLTDMLEPRVLTINGEKWDPMDWETWIQSNNATAGNQRPRRTWTIDYQDWIYLTSVPSGTDTWDAVLHYYKNPITIADGETPEIPPEHITALVMGVVIQFPNLFQGEERAALLPIYVRQYEEAMKAFKRSRFVKNLNGQWRPSVIRKGNRSSTFWGNGETS